MNLGTLDGSLGSFPLGYEAYPPQPVSRDKIYGIRSLVRFGNHNWPLAYPVLYLRY